VLPTNQVTVTGAAAGNPVQGPFSNPEIFVETNQTFLVIDEDVWLRDAIASLASGAALAQQHFYKLCVGDINHALVTIYSTQIPPNSNLRTVPRVFLKKGTIIYVIDGQLSGAAEASILVLHWSKEKPALRQGTA
jgi:hypothetical protein